jgi:hypothetical protein
MSTVYYDMQDPVRREMRAGTGALGPVPEWSSKFLPKILFRSILKYFSAKV